MTTKMLALCAFFCLPVLACADDSKPLPTIVQKYVATVKNTHLVRAIATQTKPKGGPSDTGQVELRVDPRKPDAPLLIVTSNFSGKKSILTLYGDKVTQWNDKQINTQPAPKTLAEVSPNLPMGAAASIAFSLLTDATTITDYANLQDAGAAVVDGQPARRVVSVEDGDTATFWLSVKSGLPLQARFTGGRHDRTITLHYENTHPSDASFAGLDTGSPKAGALFGTFLIPTPPKGLQVYTPPQSLELLKVGTPAPDFTLPRLSAYGTGKSAVQLSALKGQVVLIDFWASWCRPCKKTMPHIQEVHAAAGAALTAISLNTWDTLPRAAAFVKQHPNYTTQFLFDGTPADEGVAIKKYHVSGIPTVYIIDKEGNVAGAFVGDDPSAARQIEDTLGKLGVRS